MGEDGAVDTTRGHLLVAAPLMQDPNFARAVVLMLEHNHDGAIGVVLNRPSPVRLHDTLPGWLPYVAEPDVVFGGGPVDPEAIIAVASTISRDGFHVVDLTEPPDEVGEGTLRVFSGYAGWGPGQLDGELDEGAWFVLEAEVDDLTSAEPEGLWEAVLRRQGGWVSLLASYPREPWLN
jgi:putative transcriptional regulator